MITVDDVWHFFPWLNSENDNENENGGQLK